MVKQKRGGGEEGVMVILSPAKTLDLTPCAVPVDAADFPPPRYYPMGHATSRLSFGKRGE